MNPRTRTDPSRRPDPSEDWPTLHVRHWSSGRVTVTSQDHPEFSNGEHIGDASVTGTPVWIDLDGNGGIADTYEQAVEELVAAAVAHARRRPRRCGGPHRKAPADHEGGGAA